MGAARSTRPDRRHAKPAARVSRCHGATLDLERHDHLRPGERAGQAVHGDRVEDRALPRGARPGRREDRAPAHLPEGGQGGRLRGDRQGLRGLARASTSCSRTRRSRRRPATAARWCTSRSSSTRPTIDPVFFEKTYYVGLARRRGRLPPAARGARPHRTGRDRALHLPRPRVPRGACARSTT